MEVIIQPDAQAVADVACRIIARLIKEKPNAVLGLATGSTPLLLYRKLIALHREQGLDFSQVSSFNLDEYVGLPASHAASYCRYMYNQFFNHININKANVHIPDGMATDIPAHCRWYENEIRKCGGIDLQILGIGVDGHIGFNEPTSSLASRTRIKTLTEDTRKENACHFPEGGSVPHHVITMGIGTILESRCCLLLACGEKKAQAVADTVEGPVTAMVPASVLQHHSSTKMIVDSAAAQKLKGTAYYRYIYDNKPDWQKDA